ncbi:MAG TPA: GNAT family N-acetyltransferase [Aggregatilinea sp.]|uniref:GNAT family N-acetyltransferase n=1 Tax=Aggregatilinea sp. TaxID=2806333 RepID=UPI002BAABF9F|nr:GNAT family N-acetyltransferase [Aggregatilinea sp.]HML23580.1 GNAT family N-acetyltransferase [Aggregatilinea sp.]
MSVHEARKQVRLLLDDSSAADAPTAYYALFHPPERSAIFTQKDSAGRVVGFAGRFQTGIDLFRPLMTLRCTDPACAADVLSRALLPGRPYIFFANANQLPLVGGSLRVENERILNIYHLDVSRFKPELNVLVQTRKTADGLPRCVISANGLEAVAGLNWKSPAFAEIYVHVDAQARQRGWGRSVAAAITQLVLAEGRVPLYLVESDNEPSLRLAESLGYVSTGARQVYADAVYLGHPEALERERE